MKLHLKQLYGRPLEATDGLAGHVRDFCFDDRDWAVRYVVLDTGTWLPGRQAMLSPHVVELFAHTRTPLRTSLTRQQLQESPPIAAHTPISRRDEEAYYRHFGWPRYWPGDGRRGVPASPSRHNAPPIPPSETAASHPHGRSPAGTRLHSTQGTAGYHIRERGDKIGQICDFAMDPRDWTIGELLATSGHWLSGREFLIATNHVHRICVEQSTLFVTLPQSPRAPTP